MVAHRHPLAAARDLEHDADHELRRALAEVSGSLGEMLSVWPANRHHEIVLWARFTAGGAPEVGARRRDEQMDARTPGLAGELWRARGDVPLVIELRDGRTLVLGWRAVQRQGRRQA